MIAPRPKLVWLACLLAFSAFTVSDAGAEKTRSGGGQRHAIGPTETIDNGVAGAGRLEVDLGAGGEDSLLYTPLVGPSGPTFLIFELNHYVDVGANGGGVQLGDTVITQPPTITGPNQVTSAGNFAGNGGTINWTAVSTIVPGSHTYTTTLTFTSGEPFGTVRLIQYMDGDVDNLGVNALIALGTFGQPDFRLLTASTSRRLAVGHLSPTVTNATCLGWAGSPFDELRSLILGAGTTYSPAGNVINLSPFVSSTFGPGFGPNDITSAVACDLAPGATTATIVFSLTVEDLVSGIPTLSQWATIVMLALLVGVAVWRLRRRRPALG